MFLPNFSRLFFSCQRLIFIGVGTKPNPILKTLISASAMFLDDKLKTFSETNFPSILPVAGSILPALECSPPVCVIVLGCGISLILLVVYRPPLNLLKLQLNLTFYPVTVHQLYSLLSLHYQRFQYCCYLTNY